MASLFAIGDIHGCLSKLERLIGMLPADYDEDTILFIGDYIDRGPDSKGVVNCVLGLRQRAEDVICLMGNHEAMFLDYLLRDEGRDLFLCNGGDATLASYGLFDNPVGDPSLIPREHLAFFKTLLPFYEWGDYLFVHAGFRPGVPLEAQTIEDMTWIRGEFMQSQEDFGRTVIFGHSPRMDGKPSFQKNKICIDTGAVYGRFLTCLQLPEEKVYQV